MTKKTEKNNKKVEQEASKNKIENNHNLLALGFGILVVSRVIDSFVHGNFESKMSANLSAAALILSLGLMIYGGLLIVFDAITTIKKLTKNDRKVMLSLLILTLIAIFVTSIFE